MEELTTLSIATNSIEDVTVVDEPCSGRSMSTYGRRASVNHFSDADIIDGASRQNTMETGPALLDSMKNALEPDDNPSPNLQNYTQIYKRLYDWASNSLDKLKDELMNVCFAVFIEMFAKLMYHDPSQAAAFVQLYAPLHATRYKHIVEMIKVYRHSLQLQECRYLRFSKPCQTNVIYLSRKGLKALHAWLVDCSSIVLLNMVQESCSLKLLDSPTQHISRNQHLHPFGQPSSWINSQPVYWGLPKALFQADAAVKEDPSVPSSYHSESTVLVDAQYLAPLPEPGSEVHSYYRSLLREQTSKRDLLSSSSLPNILCYTLHNSFELSSLCVSPFDGAFVAAGFEDSIVRIWNISNYEECRDTKSRDKETSNVLDWNGCESLVGHERSVYALAFGEQNQLLLSGGCDGNILLWSVESRANYMTFRGGTTTVWSLDFAPFGYYFASGEGDTLARLWVTERSKAIRVFSGHTTDVDIVKFHPNSNYLFTASGDASIRMWDINTERSARLFYSRFREGPIEAIAVSPNGRLLASAGGDNVVSIWDIPSGALVCQYPPERTRVRSLVFCYGSNLIAVGCVDGGVTIWDTNRASVGHQMKVDDDDKAMTIDSEVLNAVEGDEYHDRVSSSDAFVKRYALRDAQVHHISFTPENVLLVGAVSVQYKI